jgi:hypothetical protein
LLFLLLAPPPPFHFLLCVWGVFYFIGQLACTYSLSRSTRLKKTQPLSECGLRHEKMHQAFNYANAIEIQYLPSGTVEQTDIVVQKLIRLIKVINFKIVESA